MASYFHVFCPKGVNSKYRLIVFDDTKEAFIPLTEYYHDQVNRISESSAYQDKDITMYINSPGGSITAVRISNPLSIWN